MAFIKLNRLESPYLHVCGVRLQTANDHTDGRGKQVGNVPQHHARRPGARQDVVHEAQKGFCNEINTV